MTPGAVRGAIRRCLRKAARECDERCLFKSSEWCLEQLIGIDPPLSASNNEGNLDATQTAQLNEQEEQAAESGYYAEIEDASSLKNIPDLLLLARNMIINGEYQRCHFLLSKHYTVRRGDSNSNASAKCEDVNYKYAVFLNLYSAYMAGEKLKQQLQAERGGPGGSMNGPSASKKDEKRRTDVNEADKKSSNQAAKEEGPTTATERALVATNSKLRDLSRQLFALFYPGVGETAHDAGHQQMDGYLLYLFAVVLRDINRQEGVPVDLLLHELNQSFDAHPRRSSAGQHAFDPLNLSPRALFIESIRANPWNWSCWLEFADLITSDKQTVPSWDDLCSPRKSSGVTGMDVAYNSAAVDASAAQQLQQEAAKLMYGCFLAHVYLEQHCGDQALQVIESIAPMLPYSLHIITALGLAQYTQRNYDEAELSFEHVRDEDPYRLQAVDTYSNILYVKEKQAKLSSLAHSVVEVEKFCPETCCVVGNYYSLKGQHERALLYFQRALRLNPRFLSAWTLMGHEYMELRNAAAAVQCYRNAVSISENDYRAWYGLGQTYEMLHLYQYSQYYFRKAAYLRPHDARMWSAVGNCQLKLGMKADAIVTFERAVNCGDNEGIATRNLARLCREVGQAARAAEFYLKFLEAHYSSSGYNVVGAMASEEPQQQQQPADANAMQQDRQSAYARAATGDESTALALRMAFLSEAHAGAVDAEQAEALLFLATYHVSTGNLNLADALCNRLIGFVGPEGDEARSILRDIRSNNPRMLSGAARAASMLSSPVATADPAAMEVATGSNTSAQKCTVVPTPSESLRLDYTSLSISSASRQQQQQQQQQDRINTSDGDFFNMDVGLLPSFDASHIHADLEVRGVSIGGSPGGASNGGGSPSVGRRRRDRGAAGSGVDGGPR